MIRDTTIGAKLWATVIWVVVGFFILNLIAMIATVILDSFATQWLRTWLPVAYTTKWYASAWDELASDLGAGASSFSSVTSGLTMQHGKVPHLRR